jgi:hypothetical protein
MFDNIPSGVLGIHGRGVGESVSHMDTPIPAILAEVGRIESMGTGEPVTSMEVVPFERGRGRRRIAHERLS